jgi:hypothetical protein
MKNLIFSVIILLLTVTGYAEEKKESVELKGNTSRSMILEGKVTDLESGEALTGVKIELPELELTVYSGFDGEYRIQIPMGGVYKVNYQMITYKSVNTDPVVVNEESGAEINVKLSRL